MIGNQLIDQYARNITDEKQHSVLSGSAAGTEKRYQVLHKDYQNPDELRKLAASIKDHTLHHLGDYLTKAEQALTSRG
jgi:L-lactate dehydrogenase complex protein LldF